MRDSTDRESLTRILALADDRLRKIGSFRDQPCLAIFYTVAIAAVGGINYSRHRSIVFAMNPGSRTKKRSLLPLARGPCFLKTLEFPFALSFPVLSKRPQLRGWEPFRSLS